MSDLKVKLFGNRGSLPVSGKQYEEYGGNTFCHEVYSCCLPEGMRLVIDAGTGFLPFAQNALAHGANDIRLLQTHYHNDHTQGALIAPCFYIKDLPIHIYGPEEHGVGPKQVYNTIMSPPFHPKPFAEISSHIHFHPMRHPSTMVMLIHPQGGFKTMKRDEYERLIHRGRGIPFSRGQAFMVNECLLIEMLFTDHPERTIGFRFTEGPTGLVFVEFTDNEVMAEIPLDTKKFLDGCNFLALDAQYTAEEHQNGKAGFGHGTGEFAAKVANECLGIQKIGLVHHDPQSSDEKVELILEEAQNNLNRDDVQIFSVADLELIAA